MNNFVFYIAIKVKKLYQKVFVLLFLFVALFATSTSLGMAQFSGNGMHLKGEVVFSVGSRGVVALHGSESGNLIIDAQAKILNQGKIVVQGDVEINNANSLDKGPFINYGEEALENQYSAGSLVFLEDQNNTLNRPHQFHWSDLRVLDISSLELNSSRGLDLVDKTPENGDSYRSSLKLHDSLYLREGILYSGSNIIMANETTREVDPNDVVNKQISNDKKYKYILGNTILGKDAGSDPFSSTNMIVFTDSSKKTHWVKEINIYSVSDGISTQAAKDKYLTFFVPLGDSVKGVLSYTPMTFEYFPRNLTGQGDEKQITFRRTHPTTGSSLVDDAQSRYPLFEGSSFYHSVSKSHIAMRVDHERPLYDNNSFKFNTFDHYAQRVFSVRDYNLGEFDFRLTSTLDYPKDTLGSLPLITDKDDVPWLLAPFVYDDKAQDTVIRLSRSLGEPVFDNTDRNFSSKLVGKDLTIDYSNENTAVREIFYGSQNLGKITLTEDIFLDIQLDLSVLFEGALASEIDTLMTTAKQNILPINENPYSFKSPSYNFALSGNYYSFAERFTPETEASVKSILGANSDTFTDYVYVELISKRGDTAECGETGLLASDGSVYDLSFETDANGNIILQPLSFVGCKSPIINDYYVQVYHLNSFPVRSKDELAFSRSLMKATFSFINSGDEYHKPITTVGSGELLVNPYYDIDGNGSHFAIRAGNLNGDRSFDLAMTDVQYPIYSESDRSALYKYWDEITSGVKFFFPLKDVYTPHDVNNDGTLYLENGTGEIGYLKGLYDRFLRETGEERANSTRNRKFIINTITK